MSVNCANINSEYESGDDSYSTFAGVMQGLGGVIGLGGFWNPNKQADQALSNIQADFQTMRTNLSNWLQTQENKLSDEQSAFYNDQLEIMQDTQDINNEIFSEDIQTNQLLISIVFAALIIVIIYLVIS